MKQAKYGPPPVKARAYSIMLEMLETQANKKLTAEYQSDVVQAMATFEGKTMINPPMIDLQPEIQWFMRPFLLDFLVELHTSFKLQPQTLFLCLNIIDRYCLKRIVFKRHYQLVGCTALWIAGKYEDKKLRVPTLKDLTLMCRSAYDEEMFIQMEMHILSTLDWNLVHPNLEDCLQLAIQTSHVVPSSTTPVKYNRGGQNSENALSAVTVVGRFLCEISLYERYFLTVPTSVVSITANLLACLMLQIPNASESLHELLKKALKKKSHVKRLVTRSRLQLYQMNQQAEPKASSQNMHSEDSLHYRTPRASILSLPFTEADFTDDTDDMDYDSTYSEKSDDEYFIESDSENNPPEIYGAFLSGLDENTLQQVKKTALMFIIQLSKVTEVLSRKYESLGVIQVINNFHQRFKFVISSIYENQQEIMKDELDPTLIHLADLLLQFPIEDEIETSRRSKRANDAPAASDSEYSGNDFQKPELYLDIDQTVPVTPPSASSQYSIFSNKRSSSVCNTPVYASATKGKLRIYKHRNSSNHIASTTSFDSHTSVSAQPPYMHAQESNGSLLHLPPPPQPPFHNTYRSEFLPLNDGSLLSPQ